MEKRRHYADFHLAGFTYWDGAIAFDKLKIGTELELIREADNKFDPYAVAVYFKDYKLGYVPRSDNQLFSDFLDMGYGAVFEAYINRVTSDSKPEGQIGIVVYLKANKK